MHGPDRGELPGQVVAHGLRHSIAIGDLAALAIGIIAEGGGGAGGVLHTLDLIE
jgi:hypothetical protein